MASVDLSILVVSYNTADLTVACLRSVVEQIENIECELPHQGPASFSQTPTSKFL